MAMTNEDQSSLQAITALKQKSKQFTQATVPPSNPGVIHQIFSM